MSEPKPCNLSAEIVQAASEAADRRDAVIERLRAATMPPVEPDAFETAMRALIDADKEALKARGR